MAAPQNYCHNPINVLCSLFDVYPVSKTWLGLTTAHNWISSYYKDGLYMCETNSVTEQPDQLPERREIKSVLPFLCFCLSL